MDKIKVLTVCISLALHTYVHTYILNSHKLLVVMKNIIASLETVLAVSYKIKHILPYDLAIPLLGIYPRERKLVFIPKQNKKIFAQIFTETLLKSPKL